MKTFVFRLEQVLRWRRDQTSLQKSRVSAAVACVASAHTTLASHRADGSASAAAIRQSPSGAELSAYAGFAARSKICIRDLEKQTREAEAALAVELNRLRDANRGVRLLEKLRTAEQGRWRRDFDREIEAFAGEAFLHRLQSRKTDGRVAQVDRASAF